MQTIMAIAVFVGGLVVGALAAYLVSRQVAKAKAGEAAAGLVADARAATARVQDLASRLAGTESQLHEKENELRDLGSELTKLKTERATFESRVEELGRFHERIKDTLGSLASAALKDTSNSFFQVAKSELEGIRSAAKRDLDDKERAFAALISPIRDGLQKYDAKLEQLGIAPLSWTHWL